MKYVQKDEGGNSEAWMFSLARDIGEANDLRSKNPAEVGRNKTDPHGLVRAVYQSRQLRRQQRQHRPKMTNICHTQTVLAE